MLLAFFSLGDCALPILGGKGDSTLPAENLLFFTKSVRKWNPVFFEEGSAHFSFVEIATDPQGGARVLRTDLSLGIHDQDFLDKVRKTFPSSPIKTYTLTQQLRTGTVLPESTRTILLLHFTSYSSTEERSDNLLGFVSRPRNKVSMQPISEYKRFRIQSTTKEVLLESESSRLDPDRQVEWKYDYGSLGGFVPSGEFISKKEDLRRIETSSGGYDASLLLWENQTATPYSLFTKSLYKTSKQELSFVPELFNSPSFQKTTPVGTKRSGNLLVREDTHD